MIDLRTCPGCGGAAYRPRFESVDYLTSRSFPVVDCSDCGLTRTLFVGSREDLDAHYPRAYYGDSGGSRFPRSVERAVRSFRRRRLRWLRPGLPGSGTALDLGCGRGFFLEELSRLGWRVLGTERSADLARSAASRGVAIVDTLSEVADASVDLVTLWHVLEHLPDPEQTSREIRRILRPGGTLAIEVPNLGSLQARLGGPRWFHLDVPRHLVHFDRDSLEGLLARHDLQVLDRGTFSLEYGPFGLAQTLVDRLTRGRNVLFRLLQRSGSKRDLRAVDLTATSIAAGPALLLAGLVEPVAAAFGAGGVLRVLARKPSV